ncbi:MAG TPA: DUF1987 domain-containing protein [Tenuifilaceae bacterium]|nr:DUF1987 domain-containing protein [Tenuifilaceae bacterium]HPE18460.1 DUF1987 domain-containing protein [Tenuifilaceae bacterium]HPJ46249.1 DUF1987 domain-containing protein [Tenuifilaceae bacterium]HPQ34326.1 DUF1987 domain-containing protein [Tenuifilaceae bacterium]HRX69389.1 DUF1987 domain-containing protein [Tenuifilaceae bacterium]
MEVLSIKGTSQYPEVLLDKKKGLLSFSGNSLPEDAKGFFEPIMSWIDDYVQEPNEETTVSFKMTYYNTPSSKIIFQILKKFEKAHQQGLKVKVSWLSPDDDPDMRDAGVDYSENVKIPFEFKTYKE